MSVVFGTYSELPDSPYAMWVRRELAGWLGVPDGTRVEIIGGDIVMSPCPSHSHRIASTVMAALVNAHTADPAKATDLNLWVVDETCVPDLVIADVERGEELKDLVMAVEVTSPSNTNQIKSKWTGYARAGVPFYLLVDRDPNVARATLYSEPDQAVGRYGTATAWSFGDTIHLPEPFGFEIATDRWKPW